MVEPEEATGAKDAVDVEEDKLQGGEGDPVGEDVHGVHDVQGVVPEREALIDGHEEGNDAAVRDEVVEGPVEVECGRDDGHVVLAHAHGERAGAATNIEADPQPATLQRHHLLHREVHRRRR